MFGSLSRVACVLGAAAAAATSVLAGDGGRLAAGEDHLAFLRADGSLWTSGADQYGQLGYAGAARSIPVAVDKDAWTKVSAGAQYTMAIKANGSLWAFGRNEAAQLGIEKSDPVSSPKPMDSEHWLDVAAGTAVTLGVRADGALILWGDWKSLVSNAGLASGRKGRPRQIGTGTWSQVEMGGNHALAMRADGTLWGMGSNSLGQTGCAASAPARTLCPVGDAVWKSVSAGEGFSVGIREDGTLWSWGGNAMGELGRGAFSDWETMGQVGEEKWQAVAAGSHHVLALRDDGSLWSWGAGSNGALGNGITENQAGPVMVGHDKWASVSAGRNFSAALRADGEALVWGQLGFMRAAGSAKDPIAAVPGYLDHKLTLNPIGPVIFGARDPMLAYVANHWDEVTVASGNPALLQTVPGGIHALAVGRGNVVLKAVPPQGSGQDTLSLVRAVTVAKGRQVLDFPEPGPLAPGMSVESKVKSSLGLPVALASADAKVLRVSGQRLEAVAPGVAEVTAVQPGDANVSPAVSVTRKITVLPKLEPEVSVR